MEKKKRENIMEKEKLLQMGGRTSEALWGILFKPVWAPATEEAAYHKAEHVGTTSEGDLLKIFVNNWQK